MENQTSAMEFYQEFAKKTRRKIFTSESPYPGTIIHPVTFHRKTLLIPNNNEELSFLIGYHDPKNLGENELFFGVFFPLPIQANSKLKIRRKDLLDKLNPFFGQKVLKTDSDYFDERTVIMGNDNGVVARLFSNAKIQELVIDSLNIDNGFVVGINECKIDFVPILKGISTFGIFSRLKWIPDEKIIEDLFLKIEQFRHLLIQRQYI